MYTEFVDLADITYLSKYKKYWPIRKLRVHLVRYSIFLLGFLKIFFPLSDIRYTSHFPDRLSLLLRRAHLKNYLPMKSHGTSNEISCNQILFQRCFLYLNCLILLDGYLNAYGYFFERISLFKNSHYLRVIFLLFWAHIRTY